MSGFRNALIASGLAAEFVDDMLEQSVQGTPFPLYAFRRSDVLSTCIMSSLMSSYVW